MDLNVSLGHTASYKVVFAGAFGVGKTTALANVSEIEVANNDVGSIEVTQNEIAEGKATTTVGYDYGEIFLPDGSLVTLFGLPGQERFDEVWGMILKSYDGIVLWLYGDKDDSLAECENWLANLKRYDATDNICVVVTRVPIPTDDAVLDPFRALVAKYNPYAPVMSGDPRNPKHVMSAILMTVATPGRGQ